MNCQVEKCDRKHYGRGYCKFHYMRWYGTGTTDDPKPSTRWDDRLPFDVDGVPHIRCQSCREAKVVEAFARASNTRSGRRGKCKACISADEKARDKSHRASITPEYKRAVQLRLKYGMTPEQYAAMLERQGGACAICGTFDSGWARYDRMPVDHDHATGKVRGILCHHCNSLLGQAKDDPSILLRAADYLTQGGKIEVKQDEAASAGPTVE